MKQQQNILCNKGLVNNVKKELDGEFENNVMRLLLYHADKKQSMLSDLQYAPVWIQDYLRPKIETF